MGSSTAKGTRFESAVVDYLRAGLGGDIERRVKHGTRDMGDIRGVYLNGKQVVIECKDRRAMRLPDWIEEAEVERGNAGAEYGVVVHHRSGKGRASMGEQYVTMTLETFRAMVAGGRDNVEEGETIG